MGLIQGCRRSKQGGLYTLPRIIRILLLVFIMTLRYVISRVVAKGRARVPRMKQLLKEQGLRTRPKRCIRIIPSIICNPLLMPAFPSCTSSPRTMPSSLPVKILCAEGALENSLFFYIISIEKGDRQTGTTSMSNIPMSATTSFVNTVISPTLSGLFTFGLKNSQMSLRKKKGGWVFLGFYHRVCGSTMHPSPEKRFRY